MLVSVLIPVYNTAAYLPQCLDSVISQTHRELQVVVVDDGSTDDSLEIARNYAERYPFVEVYHQENAGVASARNHLLQRVKGDYTLFVDSDDWVEPNMLEFLLSKAQEYQADVVTCGRVMGETRPTLEYKQEIWNREKTIEKFLFHKELAGSLWNKLFRTSIFNRLEFDRGISYGEDALFCWQVLQSAGRLVQTDKALYHHRINASSISHQRWLPEKMGTGYYVWQTICNDVAARWPRYLDIAQARSAMESMWALYFAALGGYPYDEHIRIRQLNVRGQLLPIWKYRMVGCAKYLVVILLSYWYGFGRLLRLIKG